MATKKNKKIKIVKKLPAKKAAKPVKKVPIKKPAKKAAPKKQKAKKTPAPKKAVKKIVKKPIKKIAKKPERKPVKKLPKTVKPAPKKAEKKEIKKTKVEPKKSLAKVILAKNSEKKSEKSQEVKAPEKKEIQQKAIIVKKSDGKSKISFKIGDHAVYPSHGVGKIVDIEKTKILGQDFSCYLMYFEKEKLTIKIPVNSADKIGLRALISKSQMDEVFSILRSGVKKLKGMWSRRAQEYETKINSGDIILLAEVLRDLTRDIEDSERSYSERIIYETAIHRLASEYAVIYGISFEEAKDKIVLTAKDKLGSEPRSTQKDEFDEFDLEDEERDEDEEDEESEDDEDEEDEDDDFDYDDDEDDDAPKKKKRK